MIRRTRLLDEFEREQLRPPLTLEQKLALYDGMLEEARQLGVIPLKDPLDGIEEDIRRARIFLTLPKASSGHDRSAGADSSGGRPANPAAD